MSGLPAESVSGVDPGSRSTLSVGALLPEPTCERTAGLGCVTAVNTEAGTGLRTSAFTARPWPPPWLATTTTISTMTTMPTAALPRTVGDCHQARAVRRLSLRPRWDRFWAPRPGGGRLVA